MTINAAAAIVRLVIARSDEGKTWQSAFIAHKSSELASNRHVGTTRPLVPTEGLSVVGREMVVAVAEMLAESRDAVMLNVIATSLVPHSSQ